MNMLRYQKLLSIGYASKKFSTISRSHNNHFRETTIMHHNKLLLTTSVKDCINPRQYSSNMSSEKDAFMSIYPYMLRDIVNALPNYNDTLSSDWITKVMDYNVLKASPQRYLLAHYVYKTLLTHGKGQSLADANLQKIQYVGWCMVMSHICLCMTDDIMDQRQLRNGLPCWYTVDSVGMIAVNDILFIENCAYLILKEHFDGERYYMKLIELFMESLMVSLLGQSLDMETLQMDLNDFSMDRYKTIADNRNGFSSFYLPVAAPMLMAGYEDPDLISLVKNIMHDLGFLFQIQEDYLDVFGNRKLSTDFETDVQKRKVSWFAVKCLENCSADQKALALDCIGAKDSDKKQEILRLYESLHLREMYTDYFGKSLENIKRQISLVPKTMPHSIFYKVIEMIGRQSFSL